MCGYAQDAEFLLPKAISLRVHGGRQGRGVQTAQEETVSTSPAIQLCEEKYTVLSKKLAFASYPVELKSHNVEDELRDFVDCLLAGGKTPTDEYEGTRTVAFAEAAIRSAELGIPVKVKYPE